MNYSSVGFFFVMYSTKYTSKVPMTKHSQNFLLLDNLDVQFESTSQQRGKQLNRSTASTACAHREIQRTSQDHVQKLTKMTPSAKISKWRSPCKWFGASYRIPRSSRCKIQRRCNCSCTLLGSSYILPVWASCTELYNQHVVNSSNNKIMYT